MYPVFINYFFNFYEHIVENMHWSIQENSKKMEYQYDNHEIKYLQNGAFDNIENIITIKNNNNDITIMQSLSKNYTIVMSKEFTFMYHPSVKNGNCFQFVRHLDQNNKSEIIIDEMEQFLLPKLYIKKDKNCCQLTYDNTNILRIFINDRNEFLYQIFNNFYSNGSDFVIAPKLDAIKNYYNYEELTEENLCIYLPYYQVSLIDTEIIYLENTMHLIFDTARNDYTTFSLFLNGLLRCNIIYEKSNNRIIYSHDKNDKTVEHILDFVDGVFKAETDYFGQIDFASFESFVKHLFTR